MGQTEAGDNYLQDWLSSRDRDWLVANRHWFRRAWWYQGGFVVLGVAAYVLAMLLLNPELISSHPASRVSSWIAALLMYALYGGYLLLALGRLKHCQPLDVLVSDAPRRRIFRRHQLAVAWRTLLPMLMPLLVLFTLNQLIGMVGMMQGDMLAIFRSWSMPFETSILLLSIVLTEAMRVLFYCLLPLALFAWTKPEPMMQRICIGLLAIWFYTRISTLARNIPNWIIEGNGQNSSPFQRSPQPIFLADLTEVLLTVIVLAVLGILLLRNLPVNGSRLKQN